MGRKVSRAAFTDRRAGIRANGCKRRSRQFLNMSSTVGIAHRGRCSSSITFGGLLFATQLREQVSPGQLKNRVGWIFLDERRDHLECALVLVIIGVQVNRQIEARLRRGQNTFVDGVSQTANAIFLAASRNPHEKAQHSQGSGQGVDIIVVEPQAKIGVREIRIKSQGA